MKTLAQYIQKSFTKNTIQNIKETLFRKPSQKPTYGNLKNGSLVIGDEYVIKKLKRGKSFKLDNASFTGSNVTIDSYEKLQSLLRVCTFLNTWEIECYSFRLIMTDESSSWDFGGLVINTLTLFIDNLDVHEKIILKNLVLKGCSNSFINSDGYPNKLILSNVCLTSKYLNMPPIPLPDFKKLKVDEITISPGHDGVFNKINTPKTNDMIKDCNRSQKKWYSEFIKEFNGSFECRSIIIKNYEGISYNSPKSKEISINLKNINI